MQQRERERESARGYEHILCRRRRPLTCILTCMRRCVAAGGLSHIVCQDCFPIFNSLTRCLYLTTCLCHCCHCRQLRKSQAVSHSLRQVKALPDSSQGPKILVLPQTTVHRRQSDSVACLFDSSSRFVQRLQDDDQRSTH